MTPSGLQPATFLLVTWCLNHYATACPLRKCNKCKICPCTDAPSHGDVGIVPRPYRFVLGDTVSCADCWRYSTVRSVECGNHWTKNSKNPIRRGHACGWRSWRESRPLRITSIGGVSSKPQAPHSPLTLAGKLYHNPISFNWALQERERAAVPCELPHSCPLFSGIDMAIFFPWKAADGATM
jgi:hypothetical protein